MKYFKDKEGNVFGVDKGQEEIIKKGWVECDKPQPVELTDGEKYMRELYLLDGKIPRWAEDLVNQGGFNLYGEAKKAKERKEELRLILKQ